MAPNISKEDDVLLAENEDQQEKLAAPQAGPRKYEIVYVNIIAFLYYHLAAIYGLYLCFTSASWATLLFSYINYWLAGLGITAGAHRLWSHRTFKAKMPLQLFLMLCNSLANQHCVAHWVRNHRLHHKYSDTDADPHNSNRGFFYSHIGWLLVKKHPEAKKRSRHIDISDIESNQILRFQQRHANWFILTIAFAIPTMIPVYFWNETLSNAWHVNMLRYILTLNATFLVNSAAHKWGSKPYDKAIAPAENLVTTIATLGEGFHNYHHCFPWDYRSAELGQNKLNHTTRFIDFCAWLGLAYDRKYPSDDMILSRAQRTGDVTEVLCTKKVSFFRRLNCIASGRVTCFLNLCFNISESIVLHIHIFSCL